MPGRDGTGPMGKGPMTGKRSGSCILRIPDNPDEPIQGFAGEAGWPVSFGAKPEREQEVFDMPHGDRTGPTGAGPRTGRLRGFCMGFGIPGTSNRVQDSASPGKGAGGQGRRNRFPDTGLTGRQRSAGFGLGRGLSGFSASDSDFVPGSQMETLRAQAESWKKLWSKSNERIQTLESGKDGNQ